MRVLFLCEIADPAVGSSSRLVFQCARRLAALGHEAAVVGAVRDAAEATPTEIDGVPVFRLHSDYPVRWRAWVSLHHRAIDRPLDAVLRSWRPDVVHAHLVHTHLGYHALTQARRAGAAVVFTAHDVMTFCYQKLTCFHGGEQAGGALWDVTARLAKCVPCQRFRFRPGRNRAIGRVLERDVHRFTVVSDALGEVLAANGVRVDATVHNGIELAERRPSAEEVAAFRERHGLAGKRVVAMGGRLHSQKGVGKLLEMLAQLARERDDVRLVVMGRRELWDGEFGPQAARLGVESRVVPTGWLGAEELARAYAAADVFATPSLCFDTFGLVNLEAMEHAKPVVATTFGGSREVVEHGVTGYVENPFDVPAYAARLGALLDDPALARRMGQAGRLRLERRFTVERVVEGYLEQYGRARDLAAGARPSS